jgi:hypothetical protein
LSAFTGDLSDPAKSIKLILEEKERVEAEIAAKKADKEQLEKNEVNIVLRGVGQEAAQNRRQLKNVDNVGTPMVKSTPTKRFSDSLSSYIASATEELIRKRPAVDVSPVTVDTTIDAAKQEATRL